VVVLVVLVVTSKTVDLSFSFFMLDGDQPMSVFVHIYEENRMYLFCNVM
jgi:hypothetical protein